VYTGNNLSTGNQTKERQHRNELDGKEKGRITTGKRLLTTAAVNTWKTDPSITAYAIRIAG
jgi:hypothetical protein